MTTQGTDGVGLEKVRQAPIFQNFAVAFRRLAGLPINLVSAEALEGRTSFCLEGKENPFCTMVTKCEKGAGACLKIQNNGILRAHHHNLPTATKCFSGLIDVYVPITVFGTHVGTLVCGQISQRKINARDLSLLDPLLRDWGISSRRKPVQQALKKSPLKDYQQMDAIIEVLSLFAGRLADKWDEIKSVPRRSLSSPVLKAMDLVRSSYAEHELDMRLASKRVGLNHYYFCRLFRKEAGIGFLEFLNRERIQQAKKLLGNPDIRIKEVMLKSGFSSMATFNRIFKRQTGLTPSDYRRHIFTAPPGA